jgi:CYTH domain-containing protein
MAVEIERRFLVKSDAWRAGSEVADIRQGYIFASAEKSVRVRTFGDTGFLTVKGRHSRSGTSEFEYEIPLQDALELLELVCEQPIIQKRRHTRTEHGRVWEIDVYSGANSGLITAEVELEHADQRITLPDWVGEEVTDDPKYLNTNLYKHPYHSWQPGS